MFTSLKQLFADLQDKTAGAKISKWPVRTPLLIWTRYYVILVAIIVMSVIYSLVYYVPQIPKFISQSVPDVTVNVVNNKIFINPDDPIKLTSADGSIILDTREIPDDYSTYPVGVFIYRDRLEARDNAGVSQSYQYQDLTDFSLSKPQIISWLNTNKIKIISILIPVVLIIALIISGFVWLTRVMGFYIWSGLVFLILKIIMRPLEFRQILPVVIYASILPLLISYLLVFAPQPLLNFLNLALFIFFTFSWLLPLTQTKPAKKLEKKK